MLPQYMEPNSRLTLREGLEEYYEVNKTILDPGSLPDEAGEMFRRHDVGHVIFACDTSLRGETLIDTWTVVATTAGWKGYLEYFDYPQVNQVFADVGYRTVAIGSIKALPAACRVLIRGLRQKRKWPWGNYESYLDRSLNDLRREFRIDVIEER